MSRALAPDPIRGIVAGLVGGVAASFAMDLAQKALSKFQTAGEGGGEPATEQAADRVSLAATGSAVPDHLKSTAGQSVHYGFGALLGIGYGVAAEYWPQASVAGGVGFGLVNALTFDEAAVPAAGLGEVPWKSPPSTHLYSVASHLVFATAAEGARRLVRQVL